MDEIRFWKEENDWFAEAEGISAFGKTREEAAFELATALSLAYSSVVEDLDHAQKRIAELSFLAKYT